MSNQRDGDILFYPPRAGRGHPLVVVDGAIVTDIDFLELYTSTLDRNAIYVQPLFFSGETGTGKRKMARTAHRWSYQQGALREVDCAYEPQRVETMLFGDPARGTPGALREAKGGSLLLSNVDYLPLALQSRANCGETRLLLTSRAPLTTALRAGRLHPLLAEMVVAELELPPLRRRKDAAQELFAHFVDQMGPRTRPGYRAPTLNPEAIEEMRRRRWPGNVCEVRSLVMWLLCDMKVGLLGPEELPLDDPAEFRRPGDLDAASRQPQA